MNKKSIELSPGDVVKCLVGRRRINNEIYCLQHNVKATINEHTRLITIVCEIRHRNTWSSFFSTLELGDVIVYTHSSNSDGTIFPVSYECF